MMKNIIFNRKIIVSLIFGCFYSIVYVIGKSIYKTNGLMSIYSPGVNILKNLVLFVVILLLSAFVFWLIISFVDKYKLIYKETKMSNKKLFLIIFISILLVYSTALLSLLSNVRLFKDSLVEIIDDVFDCYDLIINLFGGQCQII